jgi:hypothetical protein
LRIAPATADETVSRDQRPCRLPGQGVITLISLVIPVTPWRFATS